MSKELDEHRGSNVPEKFAAVLDRILQFEADSRIALSALDPTKGGEDGWRYRDDMGGEQQRTEVSVYERAMDRSLRALNYAARYGLEARKVKLRESQVAEVQRALAETLSESGLNEREIADANKMLVEKLRDGVEDIVMSNRPDNNVVELPTYLGRGGSD